MTELKRSAYAIRVGARWVGGKKYSYRDGTTRVWAKSFAHARLFGTASGAANAARPEGRLKPEIVKLEVTLR